MNNDMDPFASVRFNQPSAPQSSSSAEVSQENTEDPFNNVRIKDVSGFPSLSEVGRHAVRTASRVAETIGGIPGDLTSLLNSGIFYGLEKLTGKKPSEDVKDLISNSYFPTSEKLKSTSESLTGGYTAPQSEKEKSADEFVQTAASLAGPLKFRKALGVAASSQLAKEGTKLSGLGEGPQEAAKVGTMLLFTMFNPKGALKYASSQFNKADALAKGASVTATGLEKSLSSLITDLSKGITTAPKSAVIKPAEELLAKINKGKISVEELTAAKRDINTLMGDPNLLKREKKLFKKLGNEVDKAINVYEKVNPAFSKAYRPANQIFGTVMQGNKAYNFVRYTLGPKSIIGAALAEAALGHADMVLPTLGTFALAAGSAKTADFFYRLSKSPELRKFYTKALIGAVSEDAAALRNNALKVEEILDKDQKKSL